MWYLNPLPDDESQGWMRERYDADLKVDGFIANTTRSWSHRPDLFPLWEGLLKGIRSKMRLRAYELVTLAAARAIGCRYCLLAHGAVLHKNGFTLEQLRAIIDDYHNAGLTPVEVHSMDYADKISRDSGTISQADVDMLRQDGLSDAQITDVALAAAARNFISRYFDAIGAHPNPELIQREPELWEFIQHWQMQPDGQGGVG